MTGHPRAAAAALAALTLAACSPRPAADKTEPAPDAPTPTPAAPPAAQSATVGGDGSPIQLSPLTAADMNFITDFSFIVLDDNNTDIMKLNCGTVIFVTRHGNFKLAREIRKLRMKSRPLANNFGNYSWVFNLISDRTCILVSGNISNAIAGSLNGMHFYTGKFLQKVRNTV